MGEIDGQARVSQSPNLGSDSARFDASQYEFFGKDVTEEVELGGLDDDGDGVTFSGLSDKDCQSFPLSDREEVKGLGSFSDIDDLSSTFLKLNKAVNDPRSTEIVGRRLSFSRASSLAADWAQEPDFSNWPDQHVFDAENAHDTKRWSSQPQPFPSESKQLYRTSSYPQQPLHQQQQNIPTEPVLIPKSSFTSCPPPGGLQIPFSSPKLSHFSPPPHLPPGLSHGMQYIGGNMTQFGPPGLPIDPRLLNPSHWPSQAGQVPGFSHSDGSMQHMMHQAQSSLPHFANLQSQLYNNPHPSPMLEMADIRDQRPRPLQTGRQNVRTFQQSFNEGWPQFRAKYMSSEEIDSILRIQHAATHSNDPYVEDYYHQACVAKKSSKLNSNSRHRFCPNFIRDLPSRTRADAEPHAYLQVDALGRIPFSSIRRPRPLLEVDPPSDSGDDLKFSTKPLEQEPMLAARIVIEDGQFLVLDVEDIDRFLQYNAPQDGGAHLRRKRQGLLEEFAASLQLVDPLSFGMAPNDDLVFLRLVSLPKGRKLLSRYLNVLYPRSELARIVAMTVFRHLRFLFGELPSDSTAAETTTNLAIAIASMVRGMDLGALSACLAAVVCSSEQPPPLRPIGSPTGDGASIVVKSVLNQATELLTDHHAANNLTIQNRALWQESFNAFFVLLTKYCISKYESTMQSLHLKAPNAAIIGPEAARAISQEMPVELLRASLPHTDENQRKLLLDFAQRSMPVTAYNANGNGSGPVPG